MTEERRREALWWQPEAEKLRCLLCPHRCLLAEGGWGRCGARRAEGGRLYAESWGRLPAVAVDPVEKKPLRHFLPGTKTLSVGSIGCNLFCPHCQNAELARRRPAAEMPLLPPEEPAELALRFGLPSVSFTYNEPITFFEYVLAAAQAAKARGLKTILVSNAYICEEPWRQLLPWLDACNLDMKSARDERFAAVCGGDLSAVRRTIALAAEMIHVEISSLMVPGLCEAEDVAAIAEWLATLRPDIPLHITRYFPQREGQAPPTEPAEMYRAERLARRHLKHVYLGNI